jgi:hypothetical protein
LVSLSNAIGNIARTGPGLVQSNWAIWVLAAIGLVLLWAKEEKRLTTEFVNLFLIFSFGAVCFGFYFRPHYFVLVLPAVSLLVGAFVASLRNPLGSAMPFLLFAGAMLFSVVHQREYLFEMSEVEITRQLYQANPFPEAITVAAYIRDHSSEDSRIAVLGSEPEIYFYAQRHSVTGHIYNFPLIEAQPFALQMQEEMIRDIESGRPDFVVQVNGRGFWTDPDTPSSVPILEWWKDYGARHYSLVGVADIISRDTAALPTIYRWDSEAAGYNPKSPYSVLVFKRKTL